MPRNRFIPVYALVLSFAMPVAAQQQQPPRQAPQPPAQRDRLVDYLGAQFAISDVDGFDNGSALVLTAGRGVAGVPGLTLEGEFTTTLNEPESSALGFTAKAKYWTAAAYGSYGLPLGPSLGVNGRIGVLYENAEVDITPGGSDTDNQFGVSFGVNGSYALTPNLHLVADYTRIEADVQHFGLGARIRF